MSRGWEDHLMRSLEPPCHYYSSENVELKHRCRSIRKSRADLQTYRNQNSFQNKTTTSLSHIHCKSSPPKWIVVPRVSKNLMGVYRSHPPVESVMVSISIDWTFRKFTLLNDEMMLIKRMAFLRNVYLFTWHSWWYYIFRVHKSLLRNRFKFKISQFFDQRHWNIIWLSWEPSLYNHERRKILDDIGQRVKFDQN